MNKKNSKKGIVFLFVLLVLLILIGIAGLFCAFYLPKIQQSKWTKHLQYDYEPIEGRNPLMGYAPSAKDEEDVTDETLVYVGITFREFEPQKGVFDIDLIEETYHLSKWRDEGKKVVLRFICDYPSSEAHMDIPDWLYEETKDGTFYDTSYGKGYSPDYANEILIKEHAIAIQALGDFYGEDTFIAYVELGSVGHWGEWHVKYKDGIIRLPGEDVLAQYVAPYVDAFPNAKLLMRRPFSYVDTYDMGVYNDMTGKSEDTKEWLTWLDDGGSYTGPSEVMEYEPIRAIWEQAPVGGEFTSSIPLEQMLGDDLAQTLDLIEASHMTFLGPKCPDVDDYDALKDGYEAVLDRMGYQYRISKGDFVVDSLAKEMKIDLTFCNDGVAPLYFDWPVYLRMTYADGHQDEIKLDVDLRDIPGDGKADTHVVIPTGEGITRIDVGVKNPETDLYQMYLYMDDRRSDGTYVIYCVD